MAEVQDESKIDNRNEEEPQQQQQTVVTGEVIQTEIVKLTVVNEMTSQGTNHSSVFRKAKCPLKI